jgi:hypothetical protein
MVKNLNEKPAIAGFFKQINFPADEAKLARPVLKRNTQFISTPIFTITS